MDRALWVAMTGARNVTLQEAAQAHNLANANTTGFRAVISAFRTVPVQGASLPTRVYGIDTTAATDFRNGPVATTGNTFDFAITGPGMFAVQDADGREAYTRAGEFSLRPDGTLVDRVGRPVLGEAGPLVIPADRKINIASDGTITSLPQTAPFNETAVIGRLKLVNPDTAKLERGEDGMFRTADRLPLLADAVVQVQPGALEGSNVNAVDGLLATIRNARAFELQMQLIQRVSSNADAASRILNIR
ncbi:MAG: flagellar basal body rod protein FlgF [Rhodocyclaceae bacterium]|nr:flagellar basal body rod protein FlgF [Rhodocyclaceae bacterium]